MKTVHFRITEDLEVHLTAIQKDFLRDNMDKIATISMPVNKRSNQQLRFYWLYLRHIEIETGNDSVDMHEFLKRKLLPPRYTIIKGKTRSHELKLPKSTSDLNKIEMGEYMDKIEVLTGVEIPDTSKLEGFTPNY